MTRTQGYCKLPDVWGWGNIIFVQIRSLHRWILVKFAKTDSWVLKSLISSAGMDHTRRNDKKYTKGFTSLSLKKNAAPVFTVLSDWPTPWDWLLTLLSPNHFQSVWSQSCKHTVQCIQVQVLLTLISLHKTLVYIP